MPSRLAKLFGTEEPPAETRLLSAGPLNVELDDGNLRYIRYDGMEAIRGVAYVVRDQFWGTFSPAFDNFVVEQGPDGFTVAYDAVCQGGDQVFRYAARITGSADGTLRFEGVGTAITDFLTNRTGFVVLHPLAGVSGAPAEIRHVDGRVVDTVFPERIDPKQPMMDLRALTHQVAPGLSVTCTMEGDAYEMEDQRNWTDASYKTYFRPLSLPCPYTLTAGEEIVQSVTVSFAGAPAARPAVAGDTTVTVAVGEPAGTVPDFAISLTPGAADAALAHGAALAPLAPRFLSCYYDGRRAGGAAAMAKFQAVGALLGVDLALEAIVPEDADPAATLDRVAAEASDAGVRFASVAVSSAADLGFVVPGTVFRDTRAFDALYAAARQAFPDAAIGGGNFIYFTELNRKPPPFDKLDFVCHTTSAIVHAADDRSVTETLESLPYLIKSGRALFGDRPYRVGPSGIASRSNPFGAEPAANPTNQRVTMTRQDPRHRGLLGAAWHLGYGARMAEGGIDQVVLGAPVGDVGLVHHPAEGDPPWLGSGVQVYPVYHVMAGLYAASGAERLATEVSAPRAVQALAYRTGGGLDLWLANLTGERCTVSLAGIRAVGASISMLDDASYDACVASLAGFDDTAATFGGGDVALDAYAVARLRVRS